MELLFPDLKDIVKEQKRDVNLGRDARELYNKYLDKGMNSFEAFYETKKEHPTLRKSETKLWVKTIYIAANVD